jgi:hypothetical protein
MALHGSALGRLILSWRAKCRVLLNSDRRSMGSRQTSGRNLVAAEDLSEEVNHLHSKVDHSCCQPTWQAYSPPEFSSGNRRECHFQLHIFRAAASEERRSGGQAQGKGRQGGDEGVERERVVGGGLSTSHRGELLTQIDSKTITSISSPL